MVDEALINRWSTLNHGCFTTFATVVIYRSGKYEHDELGKGVGKNGMTKFTPPTTAQILWEVVETTWELRWTIQMSVRQHRIFIKPKSEIQNKHTVILLSIEWFYYICHRIPVLICITNPLRYSRFNFLIFFPHFPPLSSHFWSDLSLTYCSYSSSLWTFFIFKLSNKDPYGWVLRSDESIPFTVKFWKYTKDKQFKESSVVGMCFVTATSCTISMKKVNVITMESDFMRNRCCGCRTLSDGLKETMYKTITEYYFACVLYAYFRK